MLASDFFDRCDEDSKRLLITYISLMRSSVNKLENMEVEFMFIEHLGSVNKRIDDLQKNVLLYFLFVGICKSPAIEKMYQKYGVTYLTVNENYSLPQAAIDKFQFSYDNSDNFFGSYLEKCFNGFNTVEATSILKSCFNKNTKVISYERILFNLLTNDYFMLDNYSKIRSVFKTDKILADLEKAALEKENDMNVNDNSCNFSTDENGNNSNLAYGENLTTKKYECNPLLGRKIELRNLSALLMDPEKSLILYGAPGVGKTTIVKGLAYKIQKGEVPPALKDKKIIEVSASEMVEGCQFVGMIEKRMRELIEDVIKLGNAILFVDEIHTLMGIGAGSKSNNDVSNILKPYLGDGRIKIIGATTDSEYEIIKSNGAFNRRFNSINVPEPKENDVIELLENIISCYSETKNINFDYEDGIKQKILTLIVELTNDKYKNQNDKLYNPDLALSLLRDGYNYAMLDGKENLDIDAMIEGINSTGFINDEGKDLFASEAKKLIKK